MPYTSINNNNFHSLSFAILPQKAENKISFAIDFVLLHLANIDFFPFPNGAEAHIAVFHLLRSLNPAPQPMGSRTARGMPRDTADGCLTGGQGVLQDFASHIKHIVGSWPVLEFGASQNIRIDSGERRALKHGGTWVGMLLAIGQRGTWGSEGVRRGMRTRLP